jgi:hypothetical protein
MSRSARRSGRRDAKAWAERLAEAEIIYEQVVVPEVTRLDAEIGQLDQRRADLIILDARQRAGLGIPTGARGRLNRLDQELNQIDAELRFAGKGIETQGIEHGDEAPLDIPQTLHGRDEPRQGLGL